MGSAEASPYRHHAGAKHMCGASHHRMNFHWRNGLIGALIAAGAGLIFVWQTPLGEGLRLVNLSYELPFLPRGAEGTTESVTILYMDLDSASRLDQLRQAAWDRSLHARLLDRLKELHARAVVFDILFPPTKENPAADLKLVEAARRFGDVVTAAKPADEISGGEKIGTPLTKPFPELADATRHWGIVEGADPEKMIRKHYCRDDYGFDAPCLASSVAAVTHPNAPPESTRPRWVNYYGPPGTIRHFSYYQVFETNQIPTSAISNQVIFVGGLYDVGFSGGSKADNFRTPFTRRSGKLTPGVEIGATAYLNLIQDRWLRRLAPPTEALLLVVIGGVLGWGLAAFRPVPALGLGVLVALVVAGTSFWSVWQTQYWFPWMIPAVVQMPCALGWSILAHTARLAREKHSLEQALALASGGELTPDKPHPALAAAQTGMRPSNAAAFPSLAAGEGPPAGVTIPDHELVRCFGKGAYGEVWLARDVIGTFHAVKIVHRSAFTDSGPLEREFNGIRRFTPISRSHPGFVNILHVGRNETAGYIYYVMELGDDENTGQSIDPKTYSPLTLARLLEKRGRLPLPECLTLCIHLADALDYLHREQLIHRDIKPSNIIFVKNVPKFADIGLVTDVATKGRDVTYLGTPGRIAPEGPGFPSSDVYSLGKIIYEAGLGLNITRFPELPTDLVQNSDDASLFQLNRIILKACESDMRRRHASSAALRDDLIELQKSIARSSSPTSRE